MALNFNATSPLPPPIARLELELDDELESLSYELVSHSGYYGPMGRQLDKLSIDLS